jgi:two-component system LytT family response regulator
MLLAEDPEVEVIGEAASGRAAVSALRRLRPDLVLLDVQMPEMDGFSVLAALPPEQLPAVIFVTAYDRYALRAFEVHALDYLLKPFDDQRFREALERAKRQLRLARVSDLSRRLASLLANPAEVGAAAQGAAAPARRLAIRDTGRVVFLELDDIEWIEAADYYVQLHVGATTYLHRESMASLEQRLDPDRFLRIHRSAIVNRRFIHELRHEGRREVYCVLANGVSLKVARSQRDKLQRLM